MEYYKICDACGKGFVVTDKDIKENQRNAKSNVWSSVGAAAGAFSGNWGGAIANKQDIKEIKNFNKCPHCGSERIRNVDAKEFERISRRFQNSGTTISINDNASVESLLKRTRLLIEEDKWYEAEEYCNHMLDLEPENPKIYELLVLTELELHSLDDAPYEGIDIRDAESFSKLERFADDYYKELIDDTIEEYERITEEEEIREEEDRKESAYNTALKYSESENIKDINRAISLLIGILDYKDSQEIYDNLQVKLHELKEKAEEAEKREDKKHYIILGIIMGVLLIAVIITLIMIFKYK